MSQIKKISLKTISLLRILISSGRNKLTGAIKVVSIQGEDIASIWLEKGYIKAVTTKVSTIDKLELYDIFSVRKAATLKNEKFSSRKSIGRKLVENYEVEEKVINRLFQEQLIEIENLLDLEEGNAFIEHIDNIELFPWQEVLELSVFTHQFVVTVLENRFPKRYLDKIPHPKLTIRSLSLSEPELSLSPKYNKILNFVDCNLSIDKISEKSQIPLKETAKYIAILELLGIVETELTEVEALKLLKKISPIKLNKEIELNQRFSWKGLILTFASLNLISIAFTMMGLWQGLELSILDKYIRGKKTSDNEIVTLVTIDDNDISALPNYPVSDRYLATAIKNVVKYEPRVIGIDIYRDKAQNPGNDELLEVFEDTPILLGVEKVVPPKVSGPPILSERGQVGFADLDLDSDGILRRMLFTLSEEGQTKVGLGTLLGIGYLSYDGIELTLDEGVYTLGKAKFEPLSDRSGGYWTTRINGDQILIDYQSRYTDFTRISFMDAYWDRISPSQIKDKIVIFGVTASSVKDDIYVPYSKDSDGAKATPGMAVHANIATSLVNMARTGKLLKVGSKFAEIGIILLWSIGGAIIGRISQQLLKNNKNESLILTVQGFTISGIVYLTGWIAFRFGWWIPVVAPIINANISSLIINWQYKSQLNSLIYIDRASGATNRRYFDKTIVKYLKASSERNEIIGLILIKIENLPNIVNIKDREKYLKLAAKSISKVCKIDNDNNFVSRIGENTFAAVINCANTFKLKNIFEKIDVVLKSNKSLVELQTPAIKYGFAESEKHPYFIDLLAAAEDSYLNPGK